VASDALIAPKVSGSRRDDKAFWKELLGAKKEEGLKDLWFWVPAGKAPARPRQSHPTP
jgi:hypothetical protein